MRRALLLAGVIVALLGACSSGEPAPYRPPIDEAGAETTDGRELYLRDCAWCHGSDARGTEYGGVDTDISRSGTAAFHFVLTTGRMPFESPDQEMETSETIYSPAQIDAIVDYASELTVGPEVPVVDTASGDLGLGAVLYEDNCAQCHSATGTGSVLTRGRTIPNLYETDAVEIAEAMVTGPGDMPVFGPDTFDDHQVDSLVRYVVELEGNDRGGWSIGRLGPVSEGLVAWGIGLLLLVIVTRVIGTRADE